MKYSSDSYQIQPKQIGPKTVSLLLTILILVIIFGSNVKATGLSPQWFNGPEQSGGEPWWDFSTDPKNPTFGTHDWIADQARAWLPQNERNWIDLNRSVFLLGTEAADNKNLGKISSYQGYGDFDKQKITFITDHSTTTSQGDLLAKRVGEEVFKAVVKLNMGAQKQAAFYAGSALGYLGDAGAYPHTMGGSAGAWALEQYHAEYELSINEDIISSEEPLLNTYLIYDGTLEKIDPYVATIDLGKVTSQGSESIQSAGWMDGNIPELTSEKYGIPYFNISDIASVYRDSIGETLNTTVNTAADVLYTITTGSRLHPDGTLIKDLRGAFAVLEDNKIRPIANPDILFSYGFSFSDGIQISLQEYSSYEQGASLPIRSGTLVKRFNNPEIGIIESNNAYHPFCNYRVFTGNNYNLNQVRTITSSTFDRLTMRQSVCSIPSHWSGELIQGEGPLVGRLNDQGQLDLFHSRNAFNSWNYNWNNIVKVSQQIFNSYVRGTAIKFKDGSLLKVAGNPTVYLVSNKTKRAFTSGNVFSGLGFSWNNIREISATELNNLNSGARIDYQQIH